MDDRKFSLEKREAIDETDYGKGLSAGTRDWNVDDEGRQMPPVLNCRLSPIFLAPTDVKQVLLFQARPVLSYSFCERYGKTAYQNRCFHIESNFGLHKSMGML